jgi:hypothetical protein
MDFDELFEKMNTQFLEVTNKISQLYEVREQICEIMKLMIKEKENIENELKEEIKQKNNENKKKAVYNSWKCDLCNVNMTSYTNKQKHLKTYKHKYNSVLCGKKNDQNI